MKDVTVVDRQDLVAAYLDRGLFHNRAAQILDHGAVVVGGGQADGKCQARSTWDDNVI